jgi:hypothetical protein
MYQWKGSPDNRIGMIQILRTNEFPRTDDASESERNTGEKMLSTEERGGFMGTLEIVIVNLIQKPKLNDS